MKEKIILTKEQELEKQKYMKDLEKSIKELEYKINNVDKENLKINTLKRFKIWLKFCQLIAPYVAVLGLSFGAFSFFHLTPFYTDDKKKKLETKNTIDSLGNIKYEEQYYEYEDNTNIISYYGKWEHDIDNQYSREIKVYKLGKISETKILEIIEGNKIKKVETFLGEPTINRVETRNNLSKEELELNPYLEAVIYNVDKNDFIIVKEEISDNFGFTFMWLLINVFLIFFISQVREDMSRFNYKESIVKIEKETIPIDVNSLKKILELKKDNYNRLTR